MRAGGWANNRGVRSAFLVLLAVPTGCGLAGNDQASVWVDNQSDGPIEIQVVDGSSEQAVASYEAGTRHELTEWRIQNAEPPGDGGDGELVAVDEDGNELGRLDLPIEGEPEWVIR
jgi:hypothetical protein